MNVIVANKYESMLQDLEIDVIKKLVGEYDVDDLVAQFQNFYFNKMILDITALKNYKDLTTIQKLSISLDMEKVILLLDDSPEFSSNQYLSQLISMGIYNFTQTADGIMYLIDNPNSYRDVAHIHQLGNVSNVQMPNTNIVPSPVAPPVNNVVVNTVYETVEHVTRIIGIKNVTLNSGATTLTYMMKKQLEKNYSVLAIEVGKSDFRYFNDNSLKSVTNNEIAGLVIKNMDRDAIIIDINNSVEAENLCHEVIYLIEPSVIKLNKLILMNGKVFKTLKDKKVILNQSLLSGKDVSDFEFESGIRVLFNMPPLDERSNNMQALNEFLVKLGFTRQSY